MIEPDRMRPATEDIEERVRRLEADMKDTMFTLRNAEEYLAYTMHKQKDLMGAVALHNKQMSTLRDTLVILAGVCALAVASLVVVLAVAVMS